ncbi:dolichol kinase [Neonectria punicea]|uniref:dolichol kinase n=1 Tax=Neonectria punicea TaxID=979145 RepID=A0ABR1H0Q4_9HYPO
MPENLSPESLNALDPDEQQRLRALSRSPHPYHHQNTDLPHPSDRFARPNGAAHTAKQDNGGDLLSPTAYPSLAKDSPQTSDSGSEADDEHFWKGLPAPKPKPHKGLRGLNEPISGSSTPLPSPIALEPDGPRLVDKTFAPDGMPESRRVFDAIRRKKVVMRRATEAGIVLALGIMVASNPRVSRLLHVWGKDIRLLGLSYAGVLILYPLRVIASAYRNRRPARRIPLELPATFDPAPLLYPPAITLFVSLLVSTNSPAGVLPNIILSICSIPQKLIPKVDPYATYDVVFWALTCLPFVWDSAYKDRLSSNHQLSLLSEETLVLLYPLHQTLCVVLHHLTTTSLLTAELQLLSVALINVLLLASSPQAQILKALLWEGGLGLLLFCAPVIRWGIALARVPKWRFRKVSSSHDVPILKRLTHFLSLRRMKNELLGSNFEDATYDTPGSSEDETGPLMFKKPSKVQTFGPGEASPGADSLPSSPTAGETAFANGNSFMRRHTLPYIDNVTRRNATHTPSGRRKRATSMSVRPFFKLTQTQATMRKWLYAAYVYASILSIALVGVRTYLQKFAFDGNEPIGWALGYLFGDLPWFRFQVVHANLERWICLPTRSDGDEPQCHLGWVQHIRHNDFGEANTRLLISVYLLLILVVGLLVVFRLKDIYEVDTRRKVFHFMMVGMFLPTTFVDPTYAALALSLVLAVFLLLDLLRASQLPPLSKPIASFLAPYVDGRDFRGPVVISHIFLLIGCAIPLWLALASLPRTGSDYLTGWEVPTRDVSMVSGVICVGLGDAAASLIGRRYGRRKWLWGGGKSLEGSIAFAAAVFVGIAATAFWLRIGGWPVTDEQPSLVTSARNAGMCASMASLTETVLTGGNDNVIVPVVLWTCVKSLGI